MKNTVEALHKKGGKKHRKLKPRVAFLLAVGTHDLGCWKNFQAFILPHRATGRMDRSETGKAAFPPLGVLCALWSEEEVVSSLWLMVGAAMPSRFTATNPS